ncbi:MAG: Gfo/Idh/MocA family oxidoreductase, partial [Armatimonadetes bacterium]|nr:Gfo/Idh/MocA family oxidoreductase [Armatimonadota bacterium]
MEFPRLAVIGCGALASRRIYPYLGAAGARLVGACDLDLARAERNAALFGGRAYADWEAMLGEQRPDAVIVCIGPEQHAELAPRILRLGYPVYTEKPPAATSRDALAVARAAKETGLLCVTAFKKRYARCYERARQLLDEHPPEDRLALSIDYAGGAYREDSPRGTFLLDFCIHVLDLSRYLFGEVSEVAAFAAGRAAYAVSLRFACGAV